MTCVNSKLKVLTLRHRPGSGQSRKAEMNETQNMDKSGKTQHRGQETTLGRTHLGMKHKEAFATDSCSRWQLRHTGQTLSRTECGVERESCYAHDERTIPRHILPGNDTYLCEEGHDSPSGKLTDDPVNDLGIGHGLLLSVVCS